jgi:putative DNA primase/helicase
MNAPFPHSTSEELTELRLKLRANGYHPVPIIAAHIDTKSAGKRPAMTDWQTKCLNADPQEIRKWSTDQSDCTNTGFLCGEIVGVDIDVLNHELSAKLESRAVELFGHSALRRIGRAPKVLLAYRVETPHDKLTTPVLIFGNDVKDKNAHAKVEVLANGQQFVAFGIHPDTRQLYQWPDKSPLDVPATDVPLVTLESLQEFVAEAEQVLREAGGRTKAEILQAAAPAPGIGQQAADRVRKPRGAISAAFTEGESFFKKVNALAMASLSSWVPSLFPTAKPYKGGFRITSKALGRDNEEDLSIVPSGIKDWGVWDEGDSQQGKRTSIDVVMEWSNKEATDAAFWLCDRMGIAPKALGWKTVEWILPDSNSVPDDFNKAGAQPGQSSEEDFDQDQGQDECPKDQADAANAEGERPPNEATPSNDLPAIQIKGGHLSSLATEAEQILIDAGVPIYQRGDTLVRPIIQAVDASRGRKTKVAQLRVLDVVYLRDLLGQHAIWGKYNERVKDVVRVDPPAQIAATLLARVGDWKVSTITGVISAPTMRPDGSLLTEQGYDEATGFLLVEPPPMPVIRDQPTREDALKALALIEGLLVGFPFVDNVARAVALSAIITPIVRGAFPVTPMHASRAPTAGSGKSFLWDTVAAIAIGQLMPVMSTGANEEETEKRLGAAMLTAQPLISIDNISGELGGDALCQIIERPVVEIRILGRSERVRIEARGTSTFATGNNFVVLGDMCRRVITTNLDPAMERPELRQFDFDPVARVLEDRGAYIAAVLTICRAYIVAGRPNKAPRLASFEGWSDTVRSALIWLGKADPVESMESARAEDPERIELIEMTQAWERVIGRGSSNRSKLVNVILRGTEMFKEDGSMIGQWEPRHPDLYAALEAVAFKATGKRGQKPDARMLGAWLRRFKDRIVDGKRFAFLPNEKSGGEWWVEDVAKAQAAAAA